MTGKILVTRDLLERVKEYVDLDSHTLTELQVALSAPVQQQEPVAAQHRFRHPQKGTPDWSVWQPAKVRVDRTAWSIDSLGYEVEYRLLYTHPAPADAALVEALVEIVKFGHGNGRGSGWTCANIAEEALAAYKGEKK